MKIQQKHNKSSGFLGFIERVGNALPHPATLFACFALIILVLSWIGSMLHWGGVHPGTGEQVDVINLFSKEGVHKIVLYMVDNYTGFAPLGIVMVAMLGIGIAESSGLITSSVRLLVLKSPKSMLTFIMVFTGLLSNVASDLGYLLIIPIAGIVFNSVGRHPIAGMAAAFAGVSGGFSANIIIGTIDPLLAGLSTEAAQIIDPGYYVLPTANYYFMAVSTIVIAFTATFITHRFVEPRLGKYEGGVEPEKIEKLTNKERKGLRWAGIVCLAWFALFALCLIPEDGFFRGSDGSILQTPLLKGFITVLFFIAGSAGIVYGAITGKFKSDKDVLKGMSDSYKGLISFLILVFFAAQFVAFFKWSNLGIVLAINGASMLQSMNIGLIPLVLLFVTFSAFINLFMGSASAKWAILAPIFVPLFMLLGYSPELSQAVYRVGDSVTNIISPMMSFFALIIVYFEKYNKNSGIGTLVSTMLPYSIGFFIIWVSLLIAWILLGIPLGPGSGLYY